jgi:hypothetical protein
MSKKKHGIKSPRGIRAKRSARALRIFEALRSNAPPSTVLVLANARLAEATGQAANFLDVYHVSKPCSIVRGHPASPPNERSKKERRFWCCRTRCAVVCWPPTIRTSR